MHTSAIFKGRLKVEINFHENRLVETFCKYSSTNKKDQALYSEFLIIAVGLTAFA